MRWLTARRLVEAQFVEEALLINALDQAGSLEAMDLDGGADDRVAPIYLLCGTMDARMDFTEANEGNEGRTKAVILSIGPVNLQMLFVTPPRTPRPGMPTAGPRVRTGRLIGHLSAAILAENPAFRDAV